MDAQNSQPVHGKLYHGKLQAKFTKLLFILLTFFAVTQVAFAATPNPGHPWTQVGDGIFAVNAAGMSALRTFTFPDADATVLTSNAPVTVAQGGTGLNSLTANNVVLGNGSSVPIFVAPGNSGNVLTSNGTTWTSAILPGSIITTVTRPFMATGATSSSQVSSLTNYKTALFPVNGNITINQLSYNVGNINNGGIHRICIYSEDGASKLIDVTHTANSGVNNVTVSPAVTLNQGNYYVSMGCSTSCNSSISFFTSTSQVPINNSAPSGKRVYEGTAAMNSGTCNATLPSITAAASSSPVIRLDN